MATNKTKSSISPAANTRPKNVPRGKTNDNDSKTSSARSGQTESATERPQSAPATGSKEAGRGRKPIRPEEKDKYTNKTNNGRGTPHISAGATKQTSQPDQSPKVQSTQEGGVITTLLPSPESVLLGMKLEDNVVMAVEEQTRGQRENLTWFSWRKNRITASVAHRIAHSNFANGRSQTPPASYLASIFNEGSHVMTRAMAWGVQNEAVAARKYQELKSKELGKPVSVQDCGLFIHPKHSWLAASPDGIVEIEGSGERLLLEIKCPFKHQNNTVTQACEKDRSFCLKLARPTEYGHHRYQLKREHCYYTQVQCQMAVVGIHKADFVLYTLCETAIVPVTFDPEFWNNTMDKLDVFYRRAVLPHVRKTIPSLQPEQ